MADLMTILLKAFWCGWAALGFAILFNVPKKFLHLAWIGGAIVGLVKFSVLFFLPSSIILASFLAALIMGMYSIIVAQLKHEPQILIAIPSVIPLVPGAFAYRTMLGLMKLSDKVGEDYSRTLSETVHNGAVTLFIVMAFSIGIIITNRIGKSLTKKLI